MKIKSLVTLSNYSLSHNCAGVEKGQIYEATFAKNLPYPNAVWVTTEIEDPNGFYLEQEQYLVIDGE